MNQRVKVKGVIESLSKNESGQKRIPRIEGRRWIKTKEPADTE